MDNHTWIAQISLMCVRNLVNIFISHDFFQDAQNLYCTVMVLPLF